MSGSVAVVVLMAATGMAMTTLAAEDVASSATSTTVQRHRPMFGFGKNLTDAQRQEMQVKRDARKTERETSRLAIQAALDLGDYDAWVKVVPKDSPILTKVNKDNFPKLVEAHKLMKQSGDIMKELGIERGDMTGGKLQMHKGDFNRGNN